MKTKDFKLLQNGRQLQICSRKTENKQTNKKKMLKALKVCQTAKINVLHCLYIFEGCFQESHLPLSVLFAFEK